MNKSNLVKILKQELAILGEFFEGFSDAGDIHHMEVDLALSKLNDIKNELELLKGVDENRSAKIEKVNLTDDNVKAPVAEPTIEREAKQEITEGPIDEISDGDKVIDQQKIGEIEVEEQLEEKIHEPVIVENKADIKNNTEVLDEKDEVIELTEKEEIADKQSEPQKDVSKATPEYDAIDMPEPDKPDEETVQPEDIRNEEPESETIKIKETILADKFSQNKPSVNDMLAGVKQNKDLASLLKDSPIADLSKAIKLNDRIWYINELFGKQSQIYERAVNAVNGAANLDEALEYLFTNFNWNQERKSTISFLELVFRRFASN